MQIATHDADELQQWVDSIAAQQEPDELQQWVDSIAEHPWSDSEISVLDLPPAERAKQVDLAAGEYFRSAWRKRLAAAQGDFAFVARQMRKSGVPLELALVILLATGPQRGKRR